MALQEDVEHDDRQGDDHRAGGQQVNIFRPELALATLLAVIPVAVVFMLSQRALVRGLVGGGVKE